jgi:hypothetical protein
MSKEEIEAAGKRVRCRGETVGAEIPFSTMYCSVGAEVGERSVEVRERGVTGKKKVCVTR